MKRILLLIFGAMIIGVFASVVYADLTATEGLAIDLSSAGAGTDFTIAFDPTELLGNRTWGDGSTDTIVWTWNRATGTDPTITFNSGSIALPALTLVTPLAHEYGGLEADVSGYSGLVAISGGATSEVDDLSELLAQIADVTAFITDDDMPAAGANPTVDAAGEIGRDTDDHNLRGYDGAAEFVYAQKFRSIDKTLAFPDQLQTAQDAWPLMKVPAEEFPFGITVTDIWLTASSSNSGTYTIETWTDADPPAHSADIESITFGASTQAEDDGIDSATVAADRNIFIDLDTTDLDWLQVKICYYINPGD